MGARDELEAGGELEDEVRGSALAYSPERRRPGGRFFFSVKLLSPRRCRRDAAAPAVRSRIGVIAFQKVANCA